LDVNYELNGSFATGNRVRRTEGEPRKYRSVSEKPTLFAKLFPPPGLVLRRKFVEVSFFNEAV
jgi:hypothetical protein